MSRLLSPPEDLESTDRGPPCREQGQCCRLGHAVTTVANESVGNDKPTHEARLTRQWSIDGSVIPLGTALENRHVIWIQRCWRARGVGSAIEPFNVVGIEK